MAPDKMRQHLRQICHGIYPPKRPPSVKETICWADTETGSHCNLKVAGTARYAQDSSTFIQLFAYAFGDGPVNLWDPYQGESMPQDLREAFLDPGITFAFHNAWFDRLIIQECLGIRIPLNRLICTMAWSLSHGMPGSLDKVGEIVGIREDAKKHRRGKALVQMFCKPKPLPNGGFEWQLPEDHPTDWTDYRAYCKQDVTAMREIVKRLPKWNYPYNTFERRLWELDQTVNERGLLIDMELVEKAQIAITNEQQRLAQKTRTITNGEVSSAARRDLMLAHILRVYDVELPDLQKASVERIIEDGSCPAALRELLRVRLDTCTTSTAKYRKLEQVTCGDNRLRGTIQFAGASRTLRDAGRLAQTQNYPSRGLMPHEAIVAGIEALKDGTTDLVGFDTMWLGSSALRYTIIAPENKKLIVADLSNIEGRVLAWLAGEEWKLQAFRDFDAGHGADLYKLAYAKAFKVDVQSVTKGQRQVGKVMELALGYEGGCGGMLVFTTAYNVDLQDLTRKVLPTIPDAVLEASSKFYDRLWEQTLSAAKKRAEKAGEFEVWETYIGPWRTYGLDKDIFVALDSLKRLWRQAHPAIVQFWSDLKEACWNTVHIPDKDFPAGRVVVRRSGKWVRITLPSEHVLCYPGMKIGPAKPDKDADIEDADKEKTGLQYGGVDQFTKKWQMIHTHAGKLAENCWADSTSVLTIQGVKRIVDITSMDMVWDGEFWVPTDGVLYKGKQEVGTWLNLTVTKSHKILVGNEWKTLGDMGLQDTVTALESGRCSETSQLRSRTSLKRGYRLWFVNAVKTIKYRMKISAEIILGVTPQNVLAALLNLVEKRLENFRIYLPQNNTIRGGIVIPVCFGGVTTLNALSTAITEPEELLYAKSGGRIKGHFSSMLKPFRTGLKKGCTWIDEIMKKGTSPVISDSLPIKKTPEIDVKLYSSSMRTDVCPRRNLLKHIYQTGIALMRSITTEKTVNPWNGLWRNTMREENVYDLLNCGPHSRYTVVTPYGPVIVHNCTQAFARDIFKYGELNAEEVVYEIVFPLHDENVAEVPDTQEFSIKGLCEIMAQAPPWAEGLPLAAAGFEDYKYHKSLD